MSLAGAEQPDSDTKMDLTGELGTLREEQKTMECKTTDQAQGPSES
ncbi:hypothetical protein [uncultured Cohaesibacter sp.]|nr:hypothetical protein [uncultured Cohaesibacter sp.]